MKKRRKNCNFTHSSHWTRLKINKDLFKKKYRLALYLSYATYWPMNMVWGLRDPGSVQSKFLTYFWKDEQIGLSWTCSAKPSTKKMFVTALKVVVSNISYYFDMMMAASQMFDLSSRFVTWPQIKGGIYLNPWNPDIIVS